jgi:hypothetical protein
MLRRVALVTDVSEDLLTTANVLSSLIIFTLMIDVISSTETSVLT